MKNRIKEVLREKGITQKEVAKIIGMSEVGLSKAIKGSATQETINKIAEALNVSSDILILKENILLAEYGSDKTPLKLGDLEIPCYVLEDGTRVFSGRGIQRILTGESKSGGWLSRFTKRSDLSNYFCSRDNDILSRIENPIKFTQKGGRDNVLDAYGYEVTILIDICSAVIDANRAGDFNDTTIVRNADIIIRSVAKVGIIALVDEVTGYNKDKSRAKDELQQFLNKFINREMSKWIRTFDDDFFEMLYKLHNWNWSKTNKHPGVVGYWINDIVYERLGPMVLTELRKVNTKNENGNRKGKHHQFLSSEIGHPKLKEHLAAIQALGKVSGYNLSKFMQMLDMAFPKQYQQLNLLFPDDDCEIVEEK
ncbi:P63C domain-containing protein [Bacteroides intestinalis]|jgi:transcriptional regulator with XRE-family HTH domain|uniref:P63C domain protein n=1 Tax=Myoviridae sp. ctcPl3 TaxID=2826669 RepID=A0A8S5QXG1_9CAUD|nr:P63C domain-containing protein [Bacteroides intestinalis]DAE23340.1 MAG TPA: P63C domain protein [Myoviridae sp. ctcPl3]QDO70005.1 helix-turn-helix domain-containing protein [Bacteroides intestinalis]RGX85776.1 helix-turn-helix domain-containing protein [Bacteroides intestinalis]UCB34187.1 helix-turn-helix domain-containing protein [Bacteroides intestinalis]UCB38429.1 helix-turn-helix domain-containing protein [Bacteroides intestinalis]